MIKRQFGFTLIELMVTLSILALIIAIGYPAYTDQVRKARRTEALSRLQDYALLQEQYRANNPTYGTLADLGVAASDTYYDYSTSGVGASAYTLTATAKAGGGQADDTGCTTLSLTANNDKTPAACW